MFFWPKVQAMYWDPDKLEWVVLVRGRLRESETQGSHFLLSWALGTALWRYYTHQ